VSTALAVKSSKKRHPLNKSLAQTHSPESMCKNMIRDFWFCQTRKNWGFSNKQADFLSRRQQEVFAIYSGGLKRER